MARAIDYNSKEYSSLIQDKVLRETGYRSVSGLWLECDRMNGTYLDCPVSKHDDKNELLMAVAIHTPSSQDVNEFSIPVSKG